VQAVLETPLFQYRIEKKRYFNHPGILTDRGRGVERFRRGGKKDDPAGGEDQKSS